MHGLKNQIKRAWGKLSLENLLRKKRALLQECNGQEMQNPLLTKQSILQSTEARKHTSLTLTSYKNQCCQLLFSHSKD